VFKMDITPILFPEPVFSAELIFIFLKLLQLSKSPVPVFGMNMICPCSIINFYEFFYCVSRNVLNSSYPLDIPVSMVMFKDYLTCLFCSYSESLFTFLKFLPGKPFLSNIFHYPKNPVYPLIPGFKIDTAVFNVNIGPIFYSEPVFFTEFPPVFNALKMGSYRFFPVFRMDVLRPYLGCEALKLFKTVSCQFFYCSYPVIAIVLY